MNRLISIFFIAAGFIALSPMATLSQYKDFVRKETKKKVFEIAYDKKYVSVIDFSGAEAKTVAARRENISFSNSEIKLTPEVFFDSAGLNFQREKHSYENLSDVSIISEKGQTRITFYERGQAPGRSSTIHEGNIITFAEPITIKKGDFVRGMVLSIRGPVTVSGEVNKDIVSLFGDVTIVTGSVARGNIASITGNLNVEQHASIYGEVYSGTKNYESRHFRFYREDEFEQGILFNYNRVDGLLLGGKLGFVHYDSLWPSVDAGIGYAFASQRWRYHLKLTQKLWKRKSLSIGGEYYRKLGSEDDRLLENSENMIFAFLATEDFKDYFETEGAAFWFEIHPERNLLIKTGCRFDDTRWFGAKRRLWSLFGGDKLFSENFSSVEKSFRAAGITEIDSLANGAIFLNVNYDNRDLGEGFNTSGWRIDAELEWSNPDLGSDSEFRRYWLTAIRYQYLNKYSALHLRGTLANSDGYLPMYKRYYLGGLGTMMGYKHKEFIGTRYWQTNAEYWVSLPTNFQCHVIVFWDVSQIANDAKLDSDAEIRHDLGVGLNVSGLRLNVAKRLDRAADRNPRIYVRLARVF